MNTTYALETLARQRTNEASHNARTAWQRREIKVRPEWHFPKISLPTGRRVVTARPA